MCLDVCVKNPRWFEKRTRILLNDISLNLEGLMGWFVGR